MGRATFLEDAYVSRGELHDRQSLDPTTMAHARNAGATVIERNRRE